MAQTAPAKPTDHTSQTFEQCLLMLENICFELKDGEFTYGRDDEDREYWQQKLKNIAMPISLALSEYKGPRVFHHHYKHKEDNEQVLTPVMESARDNLLHTCEKALGECEQLNGMKGSKLLDERTQLEKALRCVLSTA